MDGKFKIGLEIGLACQLKKDQNNEPSVRVRSCYLDLIHDDKLAPLVREEDGKLKKEAYKYINMILVEAVINSCASEQASGGDTFSKSFYDIMDQIQSRYDQVKTDVEGFRKVTHISDTEKSNL